MKFRVVVAVATIVGACAARLASIALLDLSAQDVAKLLRLFFETFDVWYRLVRPRSFGFAILSLEAFWAVTWLLGHGSTS